MQPSLSGQEASGPWMTKFPETNPLGRATYRFGGMMRRCQTTARRARNRHAGREAFPFDQIPRYLLRDRDKIFGDTFREQVKDMQIEEVLPSSIAVAAGLHRARDPCVEPCLVISPTITERGRIFRCRRMRRSLGRSSHRSWEEWLQYPKLVDCTTATNDALP